MKLDAPAGDLPATPHRDPAQRRHFLPPIIGTFGTPVGPLAGTLVAGTDSLSQGEAHHLAANVSILTKLLARIAGNLWNSLSLSRVNNGSTA